MERETHPAIQSATTTLPNIEMPLYLPATPEEIARRRLLAAELEQRRAVMGVTLRNAADLVRQDRDEHEQEND